MALRDYERWLGHYDDPSSGLSWRLRQVQAWLREELDRRSGPLKVLSVCAGDGRDIIDVLAERDDASPVETVLLEAHPAIAERARQRAAAARLQALTVRTCDAADTTSYAGAVPADVVLLVGIFGNISRTDLSRTIAAAPQFCSPGATLLWSRGRDQDDLNGEVRAEFTAAGFIELDYAAADLGSKPALARVRYHGPAVPLVAGQHLFTFWR